MGRDRILLVDDEQAQLDVYATLLGSEFDLRPCNSAEQALEVLARDHDYPVVVSDMHLPGLSGSELLRRARDIAPDTVGIIVTADPTQPIAVEAANNRNVFRFLNKPFTRQDLLGAIREGFDEFRRLRMEKELPAGSVNGCIKLLAEVLALVNPPASAKTSRVSRIIERICRKLDVDEPWELTMAATLSELSCMTLREEMISRATPADANADTVPWGSHRGSGEDLNSKTPWSNRVAQIVLRQKSPYEGAGGGDATQECQSVAWRAACLQTVFEFDGLVERFKQLDQALCQLEQSIHPHPRDVLDVLAGMFPFDEDRKPREAKLLELRGGMVLLENLIDRDGRVLLTRGQRLTEWHVSRLHGLGFKGAVREPIRVLEAADTSAPTKVDLSQQHMTLSHAN